MKQYLKITAALLLLFQAVHLASPQYTTDSPGPTIDKSWLRGLAKSQNRSQNTPKTDATTVESNRDYSSGIASGSMQIFNTEEQNVTGRDGHANETSDDLTAATPTIVPSTVPDVTTEQPELPDIKVSVTTAAMDSTHSSWTNMTEAEEVFNNSTATPQSSTTDLGTQNSTSLLDHSNNTDSQTTLAPEGNATQESTTKPAEDTNTTESTNTTTPVPDVTETSAASSSTTVSKSTSTEISPDTTTTATQNTPEMANKTGKGSSTGSSSERGTANPFSCVTLSGSRNLLCGDHFTDRHWKMFKLCL